MNSNERTELIAALKKGTVTVTFKKVNSDEIRVMPCTLNPVVLDAFGVYEDHSFPYAQTDQVPVWSTDQNAWRSFRTDTVLGWEVLGE